ncbi:MAG: pitrilysin family protein [Bacteroidota bacterium]
MNLIRITICLALALIVWSCDTPTNESNAGADFSVPFEKYELDNGLDVVLHVDRSDPVVAVALTAHVGSAREKTGRTGFAHLFEHLLFLESENLGKGGLDKMSARIGGSGANGSTNRDRTNYFQTVPKDALEKMIWAEADKIGWFINTVTDPVLAKEKQVVKNEKRQSIDNRPYGHTSYVIDKNLYPEDHPYNWQVIGSLEDLQKATVEDVKEFFRRWYVPNNVTLTISGDFDVDQAKEWVKKYFDEIPRGEDVSPLEKRAGIVTETVKLYHEDNFARLPELTLTWPTVEQYHPDAYALSILTDYLSQGKNAPLYKVIVEDQQLSQAVRSFNRTSELAGQLSIRVRAYADKDLDEVLTAIEEGLADFEANGIPQKDLDRIKAGEETSFYSGLSSVLGKGFQLAQYNIFADDPGFLAEDIKNRLAVTTADVKRAYEKYLKDKPYIATSFVPLGQLDQTLEGSEKAEVVEEQIVQGAEETFDPSLVAEYEKTPSSFDRSVEPPYGESPDVKVPDVWKSELSNGLKLFGIESREVPLIQFNLFIEGGQLHETAENLGISNLCAQLMNKGTANKTPQELEEVIEMLGARLSINAQQEGIRISGTTIEKNYDATITLVKEMLLEPRWDEEELELIRQSTISTIRQLEGSPNSIARNTFQELIYGVDNIRSKSILGTEETISSITVDQLKAYYQEYFSPSVSKMHIVGAISKEQLEASLNDLNTNWPAKKVEIPVYETPAAPENATVYFYDIPNAKQSVLQFGYPAMKATDDDYYPAVVMNYRLGGGGFASQLTQQLREGKGYTYGIRSNFVPGKEAGPFVITSGVRSNVTLESAQLVKEILENYGKNYNESDLDVTKSSLIKSNARAFETACAKLNLLENISTYDWDSDYVVAREEVVKNMTVDRIRELSDQYLRPDKMIWLVVGDANTQLERLKELGYGDPVLLNKQEALDQ